MSRTQDDDPVVFATGTSPASPESSHDRSYDEAPRYKVPAKSFAAVEVPAVVKSLDRAVKAFGRVPSLQHTLDPLRQSIPLYLNPENPFCNPIVSHNTASHNVVLKVTVPRRTGRKRKRGSNGPWLEDAEGAARDTTSQSSPNVSYTCRSDRPSVLQRKLQDNANQYEVEAVGIIKHTHRFRGLADFYWDLSNSSLAQRYVDRVLPGDIQKLKTFKLEPGMDHGPNVDIIPPPIFTHMNLPFNYNYSQNPYVRTTEDGDTINMTAIKQVGYFIGADDPIPTAPQEAPDMTDTRTAEVMAEMKKVFNERPIWTRRSILNRLSGTIQNWNELKKYLNYAAYQFKGGPWRDSVVPYGVDPRSDPKYRIYQTLMFKLQFQPRTANQSWHSLRRDGQANLGQGGSNSHIFDGETYDTDGKVWQVCDITDPLLKDLLDNAAVRPECDMSSGWYHGGLWAKVKAVMKTKLVAIRFGKKLSRADFAQTLQFGDLTPTKIYSANLHIPLPKLGLTDEEFKMLRGRQPPKKKNQGYNIRLKARPHGSVLGSSVAPEASTAAAGAGRSVSQDGGSESVSDNDNFLDDEDEFDQDQDQDPDEDQDMIDADF